MKGFERMKEMKIETTKYTKYTKKNAIMRKCISCTSCISWLKNAMMLVIIVLVWAANAATGTSEEFRMDLSSMGPWDVRTAAATEAIRYSSTWAMNTLADAKAVVKVYPVKREKPKYIAIDLSGGAAATRYPIEYLDEIPGGSWSDEYKTSKLVLRHIPAGSFIMGGRKTDYPGAVNTNLHMVTLTKDFYMGVFEVTQRQWELVMGNRPSAFTNESCYAMRPVEKVMHIQIRGAQKDLAWPIGVDVDDDSFIGLVRRKSGLVNADLPTEAQWEYACRAGTTTALYNGFNITIKNDEDPAVSRIARYEYNSGGSDSSWNYSSDLSKGTAQVGTYEPNAWGLYDMLGNVWEHCIDGWNSFQRGIIDPVGDLDLSRRVNRGGGWKNTAVRCLERGGDPIDSFNDRVGFRLCLQGGEIPESTEVVELVNAAGSGVANWTPTKAGTYYLTHETQTNGVNGAEVLGAWFTVDAPELTFEPDGDLTSGVKVAIADAGEGWTVRYEVGIGGQGAARPTSESPEYTGPITLNDSATIRAMAFSDGGLESLEYSATFSLMSVGGAVAKPRYPWNGKVDIDVTVKGAENEDYLVSLVARDLDGGTNLPLHTAWQAGGTVTNNAFLAKPGAHRFTWDAAADITNDCEFANVVVSVSAEHSAIIAAKKVLTLEVAGYAGTETLTNVPVLVRLSTAIEGFSYADFADANGGDLIFTDESGSIVYPHEIDEWHTDGESLVWVKLPRMVNGTKFKMAYGNSQLITHNSQLSSHEVWRDYAGVWHMNEDSGTAYDSTANGLDGIPSKGTNELADISQMIAYENGACGRARVNANADITSGNYLMVPNYDALILDDTFVFSGWMKKNSDGYHPRFVSRKRLAWDGNDGWEISIHMQNVSVRTASSDFANFSSPNMGNWTMLCVKYSGNHVTAYTNGTLVASATLDATATDNQMSLALGGFQGKDASTSLNGQYDEIRLRGGTLSADRIKADYDMIVNRSFLRYGPVENGKGEAE